MRRLTGTFLVVLCAAAVAPGRADLLWDNGDPEQPGPAHGVSSEKDNYLVSHGSWSADDALFSKSATVQRVRWSGACLLDQYHTFSSYSAQVIVLLNNNDPNGIYPVLYKSGLLGFNVVGTGDLFYGYRMYTGEVTIPDLLLTPGNYFFGVRLVSNDGRNFQLSTGNGVTKGNSMGIFQGQDFYGGPPEPQWITIQQFKGYQTDYAFKLYGILPEPTGAALLAAALVLVRRR